MATNPDAPDLVFSEGLVLPDGRKVRVLAYSDGSIRFRVDGAPYVIAEAFLQKGAQGHAIVKLSRGGHGSGYDRNWMRNQLAKQGKSLDDVASPEA